MCEEPLIMTWNLGIDNITVIFNVLELSAYCIFYFELYLKATLKSVGIHRYSNGLISLQLTRQSEIMIGTIFP